MGPAVESSGVGGEYIVGVASFARASFIGKVRMMTWAASSPTMVCAANVAFDTEPAISAVDGAQNIRSRSTASAP